MTFTFRGMARLGFAVCMVAMGFALFLQYARGLDPCPLCIFQRVAMMAAAAVFLMAALHAPRAAGRWVYALLGAAAAGAGVFIAGRHVWLQSLPPDQVPACGPTLDYLLDMLPLREVISLVLYGDGNCARIDAALFGISLPGWTLITFIGLALYALGMPLLSRRDR